ncbi:PIN domain-containing protein [Oxalobacteraceae bacterium OTU3CINTB1]|nr:PIN domain-containing protein [Oxalobacteraceae bacterium OTU3CINTB1]
MAIQLFVDTNIYLNFYHFSNDDVDSLRLLKNKVNSGEVVLHLPKHVINEWERNRESKLKIAASEFSKSALQAQIPRHMMTLAMAKQYSDAIDVAKKARDRLIAEATASALTYELEVDIELKSLFAVAALYQEDDDVYARGKMRADKGNPPGKAGSVGDQYNWEMLLEKVESEDLFIISKDGDYVSPLQGPDSNGRPHPNSFLQNEWKIRKNSSLQVFDSIKAFLKHHAKVIQDAQQALNLAAAPEGSQAAQEPLVPDVLGFQSVNQQLPPAPQSAEETPAAAGNTSGKVAEQQVSNIVHDQGVPIIMPVEVLASDAALSPLERTEKSQAIDALVNSTFFQATHQSIANLKRFEEYFTTEDANKLADAAVENNQIRWIISDTDVNQFYLRLLSRHISALAPEIVDTLIATLDISADSADDEAENNIQ